MKLKIMRDKMLKVYLALDNNTKAKWAQNCSYSAPQSLYNYLSRNNTVAEDNIVDGIITTIGEEAFYSLFAQVNNINLRAYTSTSNSNIDFNIINSTLKHNISQLLQCNDVKTLNESIDIMKNAYNALNGKVSMLTHFS